MSSKHLILAWKRPAVGLHLHANTSIRWPAGPSLVFEVSSRHICWLFTYFHWIFHVTKACIKCLNILHMLGGSLAFSLHVLNPELLTLTLAQDVSESAYAPVFRFSHLIWAADPPTGWGQADGARGLMKGGLTFKHFSSHLFCSLKLCLITQLEVQL